MAKVISVVSGKGGAGKSLLTAILGRAVAREGQRVLLVDMDIFVRGLTVLLYGFSGLTHAISGLTTSDALGVFATHSASRGPKKMPRRSAYRIERFFECDVLPAVDNISAPLDYDDQSLSSYDFCEQQVKALIRSLDEEYDIIIIDNRAGMDSLVAACCSNSDIVLSVAEDDEVGRQTNANLVDFIKNRGHARLVYSIINKARAITNYRDIEIRKGQRSEFSVLGLVPFDIDVLERFGSDRFWISVENTLYFLAVIDCWNELAKAERLPTVSTSKYSFAPRMFMQKRLGHFSLIERMMRLYGVISILLGTFFWLYVQFVRPVFAPPVESFSYEPFARATALFSASSVGLILVGAFGLLLSTSGFQAFLRGHPR